MDAIIWFDVAALGLLFILWYVLLIRRGVAGRQVRGFKVALFFVTLTTIADFFSTFLDYHVHDLRYERFTTYFLLMLTSTLYYCFHVTTSVALLVYLNTVLSVDRTRNSKYGFLRDLPALFANILILTNPFTKWIFYYDENKVYQRGPFVFVIYAVALLYFVMFFAVLFKYRLLISRQKRIALMFVVFSAVGAGLVQLFLPAYRIECFLNSLACVLIYLYVESPTNYIDAMTGLLNAESFRVHASVFMKKDLPMRFLLLTVDNLEEWESRVGRASTDSMLIDIAGFLGAIDPCISAYRLSSHMFLLWFQRAEDDRLDRIDTMIKDQFSDPLDIGEYSMILSICTLKLSYPDQVKDEESLFRAISLMSEVFRHRNRRELDFEDLQLAEDSRRRMIDHALLEPLDPERFRFGWQPVYSLEGNRFSYLDTDVLMQVTGLPEVRGSVFIPIAEQNGAIEWIFPFMLSSFCEEFSSGKYQSYGMKAFDVKLPKSQIISREARKRIVEIVDSFGIEHGMINFKLDEDTIQVYEGVIRTGIEELAALGFVFSLNNYGYGYTNAEMVVKMPLVSVTLDNRLTSKGENSNKANSILTSTVGMLQKLDIDVKAEHIESEKQYNYAKKLGCSLLQGYYYSWLLFGGDVAEFFRENGVEVDANG